jgi:uncharacterized protein YqhQ
MTEMKRPANEIKFSYGGQAVIEGVLMRGANTAAIAVRNPKGEIVIHEQPLNKTLYRGWMARTPFVRGLVGLYDALGLGTRALMWAADVALEEEPKEGEEKKPQANFNGPIGYATIAVSLLLGVGLFFLLPTVLATGIGNALGIQPPAETQVIETQNPDGTTTQVETTDSGNALYTPLPISWEATLINLIEAVVQLGILVVYIMAISLMPDVKRLFGYHGAEHKTINAYEAGDELTPEIVQTYPIEHPRCGTAFLLTVVFVSVFVFSLLGRPPFLLLILSRVILIPVIAGISYELLKWTASNVHRPWVRLIIKPNLALQHLTTRQPDLAMCEVAIVAFKRVLLSEGLISAEEAAIPAPQPQATAEAAGVVLSR